MVYDRLIKHHKDWTFILRSISVKVKWKPFYNHPSSPINCAIILIFKAADCLFGMNLVIIVF